MYDSGFIPRDEETKAIDTRRLTQAYVIKASDGTKVAIALKIDGKWYSIAYDAVLDSELSAALKECYSEILIEDWARLISEYGHIIDGIDEKIKQSNLNKIKNTLA